MKRLLLLAFLMVGALVATPCAVSAGDEEAAESHGSLYAVAMYLPNRVLDVFDIVRLRVRVGPGIAADVRATEVASAFAGSYASVYVGLPGPRNRPLPKLPVGAESRSGLQASLVDATVSDDIGPDYGPGEFGAGVHLFFVGLDVGVDPLEVIDLVAGLFFIDLTNDDL